MTLLFGLEGQQGCKFKHFVLTVKISGVSGWTRVSELRSMFGGKAVDNMILAYLLGGPEDSVSEMRGWLRFKRSMAVLKGIISYQPVFEDFFRNGLEEILSDNIQHVQIRTSLPGICRSKYGEDGDGCQIMSTVEVADLYVRIAQDFENQHQGDTCGVSFIVSLTRRATDERLEQKLALTHQIVNLYPDYFIGFDLVGQEDLGRPLIDFAETLIGVLEQDFTHSAIFCFGSGKLRLLSGLLNKFYPKMASHSS